MSVYNTNSGYRQGVLVVIYGIPPIIQANKNKRDASLATEVF